MNAFKCKLKPSNDLLLVHKLLLIDVGVRIVIFHWLQRGRVNRCTPPYARCGRAAAGARKDQSLQRRTATRPYSRGAGSVERTPKRRWTEWDRSELAEPGPPWTPLHLPSNHRPSSECCPGWVFFFFFSCAAVCVCERRRVGVFSDVSAWDLWCPFTANMDHRNPAIIDVQAVQICFDAEWLYGNMLEGGTTKAQRWSETLTMKLFLLHIQYNSV